MKALKRLSVKAHDMHLVDIDEPEIPHDDWVKIRVLYAGVCGSDIKMFDNDATPTGKLRPPVIPGHEAVGEVYEVGKSVKDIKIGDIVVYHTMVNPCGKCEYCLTGNWGLCSQRDGLGSTIDGSFAEYVICPAKNVIKVPETIPTRIAALVEPLACAVRIVEEVGQIKSGENVVIFGPGAIGTCCALVCIANGANPLVVGTKHSAFRLQSLNKIGIPTVYNGESAEEQITEFFDSRIDVAIDAIGKESVIQQSLNCLKKLGRLIVGACSNASQYSVDAMLIFRKQLSVKGAGSSTPKGWQRAIRIIDKHIDLFKKIPFEEFPIDEWETAFNAARERNSIKVLLKIK